MVNSSQFASVDHKFPQTDKGMILESQTT